MTAKPRFILREDGRVERICKHGCGHPVGATVPWRDWMGVHGCDGCCGEYLPPITDRLWTRKDGVAE